LNLASIKISRISLSLYQFGGIFRISCNFSNMFVLLHLRSNGCIPCRALMKVLAVIRSCSPSKSGQYPDARNWRIALQYEMITFHGSLCNVSLRPVTAAISTWQVRTRSSANLSERGVQSLPASTTAMPTRFSHRPAKLSGKLAICQQQTAARATTTSRSKIMDRLCSSSSHVHHIIYTKCPWIITFSPLEVPSIDVVIYVSLYRLVPDWPETLITEIKNVVTKEEISISLSLFQFPLWSQNLS